MERLPSINEYLSNEIEEGAVIQGIIRLEDDFFDIKRIEAGFHGTGVKFDKEVKYNPEKRVDDVWYTIKDYDKPDVRKKVTNTIMKPQNRLNPSAPDSKIKDNYAEFTSDIINAIKKTVGSFIDKPRDVVIKHLSKVYNIDPDDAVSVINKLDYKFAGESKILEVSEDGGNIAGRLPTLEQYYSNHAGYGISPKALQYPFLTFDRLPNFYAGFSGGSFGEEFVDQVSGGRADKKSPEDYDPFELELGIRVETEHTDDPEKAKEIAMDHLEENPAYYSDGFQKAIFDEDVTDILMSDKWKDDPRTKALLGA